MKKPTQKQAVLSYLIHNGSISGSECHKVTKKLCNCASLNLHKLIASLKEDGVIFKPSLWFTEGKTSYKRHYMDLKKTPKKLLQSKSN